MATHFVACFFRRQQARIEGNEPMNNIEQRLTDLEMRFTFQEETITQLDQVVAQCNLQIQQLVKENHQLRQMLRSLAPETAESPDE